ncbi:MULTISPECIES: DUF5677 domain-containing protein [Burkholderia cepacia complex]|uniref:DUF5677 domain-containing protein n=1 Tax=Burkholderia cepacia complex TaxID=87882 RepID=UPI001053C675|nr:MULTISPECIES: DUF5677 domain-containing protein [Burkholderia cepacia complex]MBJ9920529.1 hypothetical protein [Burkholderia cenocepacia]MCA7941698.1 DUF5677 domain-containing protein [Burkholderia cepacia]
MSNFERYGLAGDGAANLRSRLRVEHADLFQFGDRCMRIVLDVTALLPLARASRQVVVSQFFARAASHFQAGLMLTECGMAIESLTLSRSLFETCFVMLAIAENAVMPDELLSHDNAIRLKHANALLNSKDYPNVEPYRETLETFVRRVSGAKEIGAYEFARRGKALAMYDGPYRHLSHQALHATLSAVDDYLAKDADGKHYVHYRPLLEKTPAAVLTICAGILLACFACDKASVCTPDTSETLSRAWAEYESLYEKHRPWS